MFGTNSEDLLLGVDSDRFNQRDGSVFESKPFAYQSEEEYEEDQSKIANVMEKIDRNPQAFERFRKMGAVNINVNEVRVNGLKRSKREWVESEIGNVESAKSLKELQMKLATAHENLSASVAFKNVAVSMKQCDDEPDPEKPLNIDVVVDLDEASLGYIKTGTEVGKDDGSVYIKGASNSPTGHGESLELDISKGSTKTQDIKFKLNVPTSSGNKSSLLLESFKVNTNQNDTCGYSDEAVGFRAAHSFRPSTLIPHHNFGIEAALRDVNPTANAAFDIWREAGPSFKLAALHSIRLDTRDNPAIPTRGFLLRADTELAGLVGNTRHLKSNLWASTTHMVYKPLGITASFAANFGFIKSLSNRPTRICDRFFLGGPHTLRGFPINGAGPRSAHPGLSSDPADLPCGDAVGGDVVTSACVSLSMPAPFPKLAEFGGKFNVYTHFGNLFSARRIPSFRGYCESTRVTLGCGVVLPVSIGRIEVNYNVNLRQCLEDRVQSLQIGFGIDFM